ncbi:hypothetical protein CE91St41_25150 [Oscillospiraceae bacterium]|nr:hypothetical protein CE91St40_12390 [Oscillospiraceae bacterium]BDF75626.1 hypothetical protein CE91St41_25150 [Oscillospiraceae bacterium]
MIQKLKAKTNNKKGFTLAELLIVVAIIGVLVAVAIPVFTSQLNSAKAAVAAANARTAKAMAVTEYLTENPPVATGTEKTYSFGTDNQGNFVLGGANDVYTVKVKDGKVTEITAPTA